MTAFLVQEEDGTSKFTLEENSGSLQLETTTPSVSWWLKVNYGRGQSAFKRYGDGAFGAGNYA